MQGAFGDLGLGLMFAAVFVYMLMVVNYQSFLDPLAVILAYRGPGWAFCYCCLSRNNSECAVGHGGDHVDWCRSANSILLVTFAREQRLAGHSAFEAALSAGTTRLRPVLMTAAAMIVGMIPMAIGGPGEEQNAVLAAPSSAVSRSAP